MDDYRDISAKDFERYEKIRTRFSDIVKDFDLITNSTPGTLRIDPVIVTYDLAAASGPAEISLESPTFTRAVESNAPLGEVLSGGSGTLTLPHTQASTVTRMLAARFQIDNSGSNTGNVRFYVRQIGGTIALNAVLVAEMQFTGADTFYNINPYFDDSNGGVSGPAGYLPANAVGTAPSSQSNVPGVGVTIGENQEFVIDVNSTSGTSDVTLNYEVYYEQRE